MELFEKAPFGSNPTSGFGWRSPPLLGGPSATMHFCLILPLQMLAYYATNRYAPLTRPRGSESTVLDDCHGVVATRGSTLGLRDREPWPGPAKYHQVNAKKGHRAVSPTA